jgi:hypothetical protein
MRRAIIGVVLVFAMASTCPAQSMRPGRSIPARTGASGSTSGVPVVSVDQVEQYLAYARSQLAGSLAERDGCRTRYYSALSILQCEQGAERMTLYWTNKVGEYERLADKMRAP